MKNKNIYKQMEKDINQFIEVHSADINKPKEETKKFIRDFIEKMAIWYELRYPDCEIKRMFDSSNSGIDISNEIFYNNPYIADILKNSMVEIDLKWQDFYNYDVFYESLSQDEKNLLKEPCYPGLLYLYKQGGEHIHVFDDGLIDIEEYTGMYNSQDITFEYYKSVSVDEFIRYFKKNGKPLPNDSEVVRANDAYYNQKKLRNRTIDCVMYRIMMRGDKKQSSLRRAYLFAKEFNPYDIDFIADYAIHYGDNNLLKIISTELKTVKPYDIIIDKTIKKHLKLTNLY